MIYITKFRFDSNIVCYRQIKFWIWLANYMIKFWFKIISLCFYLEEKYLWKFWFSSRNMLFNIYYTKYIWNHIYGYDWWLRIIKNIFSLKILIFNTLFMAREYIFRNIYLYQLFGKDKYWIKILFCWFDSRFWIKKKFYC